VLGVLGVADVLGMLDRLGPPARRCPNWSFSCASFARPSGLCT
jgi:hypothetical protein